ncbi:sigma-70 family RNA polymerase sigma factor [Facklamia sp. 7083-14-GEN3]|uniref:sigma-70 family RNA polymerase sigma factor n=1 Tax=Facklamia sp. 7083-14-GEN3 TaxID=2973478 RepID=UPI00215CF746|nr:sigma-70 family RNA polymerase sigma factor [Facklamia sp. 7083-14-GEN3]MCR8969191.1 sigma-70 family RNA polymerase sigma factor [Facklamia sp. 7083-14-GEN3]
MSENDFFWCIKDKKGGNTLDLDNKIIKLIRKRNEKGIRYLIEKYGGLLYAVIRKHSQGYSAYHEECFNDVLLAVWKNIEQFDPKRSTFKNWIMAIARYRALNLVRKNQQDYSNLTINEEIISEQEDTIDGFILREDVNQMIQALSPQDQKIFIKLFFQGLTTDEVAQDLDTNKNTIYQHLSRARKKLRKEFNYDKYL